MDAFHQWIGNACEILPPEFVAFASHYINMLGSKIWPHMQFAVPVLENYGSQIRGVLNRKAEQAGLDCTTIILLTIFTCLVLQLLFAWGHRCCQRFTERGFLPVVFDSVRSFPPVASYIAKEKKKMKEGIVSARTTQNVSPLLTLPAQGKPAAEVYKQLQQRAADDVQGGTTALSGAIYMPSEGDHRQLLDKTYSLFSLSNPLHADAFPSIRQMEAEVVAITANLLGGSSNTQVCGAMTSGGTESILSAVKASRDYMAARKGIREPEMIIGVSAHAAYWKAAEYFKIKLRVVPVGRDYRLSAATVRRHLTRNTVLLVASAPGFPHGLVDDVQGIAKLAARRGICCHVDACLGGYCLPFVRRLGRHVSPFDFSVKGVTSMSVDTHKFGMAHKGTSVVLYAHPELRAHQYTRITDWSGGLYISPGMAGSRPGALIATAWAALVHLGEDGLVAATARIMEARDVLVNGIWEQIPELEVIGEPEMGVVAFRSGRREVNVYALNNWLTTHGWHMNALQGPPALHFCFTAMNAGAAPALLTALKEGVRELLADPEEAAAVAKCGAAPLYGMANVSPDRGMVGEFLEAYQDVMLMP